MDLYVSTFYIPVDLFLFLETLFLDLLDDYTSSKPHIFLELISKHIQVWLSLILVSKYIGMALSNIL